MLRILAVTLALFAANSASAQDWRGAASPYDIERLDIAAELLAHVIPAARKNGDARDVRELDGIAGPSQPIEGEALIGNWKCRTMKLAGKYVDLIVYGWFKCRISFGAEGLFFEKLTGSQRTSGYLWPEYPASGEGLPVRYIYLGAAHYGGEELRKYGGPKNTLLRVRENRDDPGILEAIGRNHMRIGFPMPVLESEYNFLELKR